MPKRPTTYHRPQDLSEALRLLQAPDAAPLGGGTCLLANDIEPDVIVDLQDLPLRTLEDHAGWLHIGAGHTLRALDDALDGPPAEFLREAIHYAGPNTIRNAATLGGTVGARAPESELLAGLLALDAEVMLVGQGGEASIPLADYLLAEDRPVGLVTALRVRWAAGAGRLARVARTPQDAPIVSVVAWSSGEGATAAAVGIAPVPVRLADVPALDEAHIGGAVESASAAVTHPGDFRGSADYRRAMVGVLLRRVLEGLRV